MIQMQVPGSSILIATASPSSANVDFQNVPQGYRHLEIIWQARGTDAATQVIGIRFNNDSGNNYDHLRQFWTQAGFGSGADTLATSYGECGVLTKSGLANYPHQGRILVCNYRATSFYKSYEAHCSYIEAASDGQLFGYMATGWWRNAAAISRVQLVAAAGGFASGSYVELWGLL